MDDIFATFESELDGDAFCSYLNTRHENIKFTFEKEKDNKLPFLDILINNNQSDLQTSVFHKKTYTGLLLNYFSFVPNSYKLGLSKRWLIKCIGLIILGQVLTKILTILKILSRIISTLLK